ncbi:MAG: MFS transporter [Oscillospiraceae bacterium]|nr:MFS transporter [Oscillospiraceae bacterium]
MDKNKQNKIFFLSTYFIMFITGLGLLSTGAILPEIVGDFQIGYDMAGVLLSLQATGNLTAVVVSGYLLDILGRKIILLAGSSMLAIGFLGIAFVPYASLIFVFIFFSGCGWGINNIVSGITNDITGGSAAHLNRLHIFFAVGGFTAPFFVVFVDYIGFNWRVVAAVIGLLAVISVIIISLIKIPLPLPKETKSRVSFEAFRHLRYYIFIAIQFTYAAVETVMNGWITTYFQGTGILTNIEAKTVLSLIWISIMVGRIIISVFGKNIKKEHILVACSLIVLIFSTLLIRVNSLIPIAVCVFALGLGLSALIPTNLANSAVITSGSGVAMGVLLSSGGLGAAVGPAVTGVIAERLSLNASMWVAVGFALILLIMAIINNIFGRKIKNEVHSN